MYLKDFNYIKPGTIEEACNLLEQSKNGAPIAGGTDLLVEMKMGLRFHEDIISISKIEELKKIEENVDELIIGAGATHSSIVKSELVNKYYPCLAVASSKVGTEQVRNSATVGGNICTGASCCDTGPVLMASGAKVEITGVSGKRTIPIEDFFIFHRKTAVQKGEIVSKLFVPKMKYGFGAAFEKYGLREAASISVASAITVIGFENGVCTSARIVLGAVAPIPVLCKMAAEILIGKKIEDLLQDSDIIKQAAEMAVKESRPITDIRGSKEYRKHLVKILVARTIKKAAKSTI